MDADSSHGGSDTAQDSRQNSNSVTISTSNEAVPCTAPPLESRESQQFYHKNEIVLPVSCDDTLKLEPTRTVSEVPQYKTTAKLNINESLEHHSNLDQFNRTYNSMSRLNEKPVSTKSGVTNPGFENDVPKSTFDNNKPFSQVDLNSSDTLELKSPTKGDNRVSEAVNLELIHMKSLNDPKEVHEHQSTTMTIPIKKETEVDLGDPYDEYFVPVNEHRKYMRYVTI